MFLILYIFYYLQASCASSLKNIVNNPKWNINSQGMLRIVHSLLKIKVDTAEEEREGSGFFINKEGLVFTAHHVVNDYENIKLHSGTNNYHAYMTGFNKKIDLALLSIKEKFKDKYLYLETNYTVGDTVYSAGFIRNRFITVNGIIESINHPYMYIKFSPNIVGQGLSGSPIINRNGDVIGMISKAIVINGSIEWIQAITSNAILH